VIPLPRAFTLRELASRFGGQVGEAPADAGAAVAPVVGVAPIEAAGEGTLAPLLHARYARHAEKALARGAAVLALTSLAERLGVPAVWSHAHPAWALAAVLDLCAAPEDAPLVGEGTHVAPNATLFPRVRVGRNVRIAPGCVIGAPGFGWVTPPDGGFPRRVPQLGGVVIEDDVEIGALCTIDAGTLGPTRVGRGAKLDAQVHLGHNVDVGEGSILAAQCGLAGSVRVGRGVLLGGQVGVADHVVIGDGARVAAKSGVIGDVPPGAVVAGYPAVPRARWLRALAKLYRGLAPPA
jgi:UDP-3-O-[3-hydroxymyristoyl] glucosamine N-acyltransferase